MHTSQEKLSVLRKAMRDHNIGIYVIPDSDPHMGENIPDHWRIISWLTGFTGSASAIVITGSFAGLWTDSRYFLQAQDQLAGSGFSLIRSERNDFIDWLKANTDQEQSIGFDGRIMSITRMRKIEKALEGKKIRLNSGCDLISDLWKDRPFMPDSVAFDHPVSFCGKERMVKISEVRQVMRTKSVNYHLLTSPDDIMWLLNIRGNDIQYSPLLISYAVVGEEQILLFTDENKIPLKIASEFDKLGIVILPYEETAGIISTLEPGETILITPGITSCLIYQSIPRGMNIIEDISIPTRLKAVKNKVEIENLGRAMIKDGVALTRFFYWIEQNRGEAEMTELSLAEKLYEFRSEQENFLSLSFATIAAFNNHGALPHYSPTSGSDSIISGKGILLIDSGSQYLDGTTDITRTIALGTPTSQQKKDFTLVLKGAINLALAKFPLGTTGHQLDLLARKFLWDNGLNYGHGTGHGVGFCLNVHEGPQSISAGSGANSLIVLEPGMLTSDEPAVYREGEYGIRTENLILCYEDEETGFGKFLKFDTMSLCYIDKTLIDTTLLDLHEITWLNSYHTEVFEKLSPRLTPDEVKWLKEKTGILSF